MKIEKAKQLTARKFKRMTGVSRQSFELMVDLVKASEKNKKKPGRRSKLIIEEKVLMVIQYWREYRTYYHIGLDWGLGASRFCKCKPQKRELELDTIGIRHCDYDSRRSSKATRRHPRHC